MREEILNRFSVILGEESAVVELDKLTSAKKARFVSWLRENNFSISDTFDEESQKRYLISPLTQPARRLHWAEMRSV